MPCPDWRVRSNSSRNRTSNCSPTTKSAFPKAHTCRARAQCCEIKHASAVLVRVVLRRWLFVFDFAVHRKSRGQQVAGNMGSDIAYRADSVRSNRYYRRPARCYSAK
eukprot:1026427-Rhodomonas_salina.2